MKNLFQKYIIFYLAVALVSVSLLSGFWLGQKDLIGSGKGRMINLPEVGEKPLYLSKDVNFDLFHEIWQIIKNDYIDRDEILDSELFYGSLKGVVASLDDPHSVFLDPQTTWDFSQELEGNFEGIGAEITIKKDQLIVVSPLPGTPAYQAGLQPLDKILAIDEQLTALMTLYEAVDLIRGPRGTAVKLLIGRESWTEPKEIEITRAEIHFDSVNWEFRDDNLVYIRVISFNDGTIKLFNQAVRDILSREPAGIILDLRGNPGGYFDQAITMTSEWVKEGIVVIEAYDGQQKEYQSAGRARLADYPTVVLVNAGSASSSEIVAGALQDHQKATVVGIKTFGKGSVQELKLLSDGSAIKLTTARWLTPGGRQIEGEGITPDFEIEQTGEDYDNDRDPQLDKAVEILLGD